MAQTTNASISPSKATPGIGHNSGNGASETRTSTNLVDADLVDVWLPNEAQFDEAFASDLTEEVQLLETVGQRAPVVVRKTGDRYEAITRIKNLAIVLKHNESRDSDPLKLQVTVHAFDDDKAYHAVALEQDSSIVGSVYSRASFFAAAVKNFGSAKAAAETLKVSEAALSKSLDVMRAANVLKNKILIPKDITQRDAAWLMAIVGRSPKGSDVADPEKREAVLQAIKAMEGLSAKAAFKELKKAAGDGPARKLRATHALEHDGTSIGSLQRGKAGRLMIKLENVGDIEPQAIADLIRQAISDARFAA